MKPRGKPGLLENLNLGIKDELIETIDKIKILQPELFKKSK